MPSIQGCIIDGRHGCTRLGCVGNKQPATSWMMGCHQYRDVYLMTAEGRILRVQLNAM
ncbi:hypothetical protein [uncultured Psychrosphaera sp.]|uniref:hypothetical protein n=1 Tax=uncultured Psychrosphaera sp. TaxID=1403522 RepID=UPI0026384BD0|nr:hypothetical protein [uncultured Psychrosphaera sp.]